MGLSFAVCVLRFLFGVFASVILDNLMREEGTLFTNSAIGEAWDYLESCVPEPDDYTIPNFT